MFSKLEEYLKVIEDPDVPLETRLKNCKTANVRIKKIRKQLGDIRKEVTDYQPHEVETPKVTDWSQEMVDLEADINNLQHVPLPQLVKEYGRISDQIGGLLQLIDKKQAEISKVVNTNDGLELVTLDEFRTPAQKQEELNDLDD